MVKKFLSITNYANSSISGETLDTILDDKIKSHLMQL
jgi:hypothetical protein